MDSRKEGKVPGSRHGAPVRKTPIAGRRDREGDPSQAKDPAGGVQPRDLGGEELRRAIARRQAPKATGASWPALTGAREGIDPNKAVKADSRTLGVA